MKTSRLILLATLLVVALGSCTSNEKTDSGGVILAYGNLNGIPQVVSMNGTGGLVETGELALGLVEIRSILAQPGETPSSLMDVQLRSYEVTYSRGDGGTRLPPPLVRNFSGNVPAGGNLNVGGALVLWSDQIFAAPIVELAFANGGLDSETGRDSIILNYNLRFFGKTVSGKEIETPVLRETILITR